ncbi:DUF3987 domain-containing protein, partial [bacterium]|nr:DUF3987 domain-containing protein [bacterium]
RQGVYCDELASWFRNFNRYNAGSEMEFWLSVWSAKPVSIDRKSDEPVYIQLPFISVAGTIQTGVLNELAKDNRTQNGFIDRILFVMPDNLQKPYWSDTDISPNIITNWQAIINKLLGVQVAVDGMMTPVPEMLYFTQEAKEMLFAWQKRNVDESNTVENEAIEGIYAKLEMYAVRLSLILELMFWACGEGNRDAVTAKSVRGALMLVEYFKCSAIKAYNIISNTNPIDQLPLNKRNIYNALPYTFTTEQGIRIAEGFEMPERTFMRFIKQKTLFTQLSRGEYEKQF